MYVDGYQCYIDTQRFGPHCSDSDGVRGRYGHNYDVSRPDRRPKVGLRTTADEIRQEFAVPSATHSESKAEYTTVDRAGLRPFSTTRQRSQLTQAALSHSKTVHRDSQVTGTQQILCGGCGSARSNWRCSQRNNVRLRWGRRVARVRDRFFIGHIRFGQRRRAARFCDRRFIGYLRVGRRGRAVDQWICRFECQCGFGWHRRGRECADQRLCGERYHARISGRRGTDALGTGTSISFQCFSRGTATRYRGRAAGAFTPGGPPGRAELPPVSGSAANEVTFSTSAAGLAGSMGSAANETTFSSFVTGRSSQRSAATISRSPLRESRRSGSPGTRRRPGGVSSDGAGARGSQ